jgi:hypothetical protein
MDGLLSMFKEQFKKGEPYRDAFRGLLRGDTTGWNKLNAPSLADPQEAVDIATGFAGTIKPVQRKVFEEAFNLAQQRAALPVSEGGLGLPATNTAMDRAKAMGYDTSVYHATNNDVKNFIPSDVGTYGPGVYTAKRPEIAEGYYQDFTNSNTMPLLINKGKEKQFQSFSDYVGQKGKERNTFNYGQDLRDEGYNSLSVKFFPEGEVREYASFNPSDVRSVNAAFDPFRRNEPDILAGVAAAPAGLLAIDEEKPKKKRSNK